MNKGRDGLDSFMLHEYSRVVQLRVLAVNPCGCTCRGISSTFDQITASLAGLISSQPLSRASTLPQSNSGDVYNVIALKEWEE